MPGTVIGTSLNNGYLGQYSRNGDCIIVSRQVRSTDTANISFGDAVVLNSDQTGGTFSSIQQNAAGFTFAAFAGIAVREVATMSAAYSPAPTIGNYLPGQAADVLARGSTCVQFGNPKGGNATAGGAVFVRISTNGGGTVVGQFEPIADAGHTIQLTNAAFQTGVVDANGVAEITLLSRNLP